MTFFNIFIRYELQNEDLIFVLSIGKGKIVSSKIPYRANKGRGFYSKNIFSALNNGVFRRIMSMYLYYVFAIAQNSEKHTYFW